MTRPSERKKHKKEIPQTQKPSPLHSIVRSEIERLFIKILYVLDDNRRSQLVWKDETQVDLRSENNRVWQILEDLWQIWTQKLIWAPMRPLLVTKHSTGCSDHFFSTVKSSENAKIRFVGGKKLGEWEIGSLKKKLHLWDSSCGSNGPQSHKKCLIRLLEIFWDLFTTGKIDKWSDWGVLNLT